MTINNKNRSSFSTTPAHGGQQERQHVRPSFAPRPLLEPFRDIRDSKGRRNSLSGSMRGHREGARVGGGRSSTESRCSTAHRRIGPREKSRGRDQQDPDAETRWRCRVRALALLRLRE